VNSFFVADRGGNLFLIAGSLFATVIGGSSTVGMAGLGYKNGLVGAWWLLVGAIGLFVLGIFLAEKVRGYSLYTLPEILEKHYGSEAKFIASGLIVIAWMGIIAGQIVAAGKILGIILNISPALFNDNNCLSFYRIHIAWRSTFSCTDRFNTGAYHYRRNSRICSPMLKQGRRGILHPARSPWNRLFLVSC